MNRFLKSLTLIFCLACPIANAQQEKPLFKRHFIEIAPIAVTFKKGVTYSHHLEYRLLMTQNLYMNAGTTLTPFKKLDYSRNQKFNVNPLFNESSIVIGYQHIFNQLTETNRKTNLLGVDAGYHYMQYSTSPHSGDYTIIDSTTSGFRKIGGYRVHSLKAGLVYQHIIYDESEKPRIKFRHILSFNYMYSINFQQPTYIILSDFSASKSSNLEQFSWRNKNGFKVEYTFQHPIGERIGLLHGFNFTYAPLVDYQPNYNYFVPRGGDFMNSMALTFRIGITI